MADLIDIQAAQSVKIVGSGPTGQEGVPVGSTTIGELKAHDRQNILNLLVNSNFAKLANYTSIVPTYSGNYIYLDYYENVTYLARLTLRYVSEIDWDISLASYINNDDGLILQDDDSTYLNIE